jgi:pyruvate, water dikinase
LGTQEKTLAPASTGLTGLDRMLKGLMPGDNVVWEVDSIEEYKPFVRPFLDHSRSQGIRPVYFRFARHEPLLAEGEAAEVVQLSPEVGFERFIGEILDIVEKHGRGANYLFDCLSDLAADWYSDRMLGNFFMIVCPFLYDLDTIAYFALIKNHHSFHATDGIFNTAQVILEVYRHKSELYLHPMKVHGRSSPTLYMIHQWRGEAFDPVTNSAITSEILAGDPKPWLEFSIHRRGVWAETMLRAQEVLAEVRNGAGSIEEASRYRERLLRMAVTRDERFLNLARRHFDLSDLVNIIKRMIGTGLIGGKSLGMLLARAILEKADSRWADRLEVHDSFFIGSDVFYTYLVQNGCWWLRRKQTDFETLLKRAEEMKGKLLTGTFPEYIRKQFTEMLEYFGQSPIIVRSSSLLEDNYGNAFSGKYESVYCANQGTPQERLEAFMAAVRRVYVSTMSKEALNYRLLHGLLDRDEQMAILVQRVSGTMYDGLYFPLLAGVGFSFNPYAWNEEIDPNAGMLRLVGGLGTRAVDRHDDDYTRVVALNVPQRRPEAGVEEVRRYVQKQEDVLDMQLNQLVSRRFEEVGRVLPRSLLQVVATCDSATADQAWTVQPEAPCPWTITFDRLFADTEFVADMRAMLRTLQDAYNYPVDIEFTVNFLDDGRYRINLVQCRPFQVRIKREGSRVAFPESVNPDKVVLRSRGPIIGQSMATTIDRLIYVVPTVYGKMTMTQRYSVARTIGRLTRVEGRQSGKTVMLVGPGRWGTSMPSLGVPVSFAEINLAAALCEIVQMREGLAPDVSLGTHFFNDLVEMDMLYWAIFPDKAEYVLNDRFLREAKNRLTELLPDAGAWSEAIRVVDATDLPGRSSLYLNVDAMKQKAVCYVDQRNK